MAESVIKAGVQVDGKGEEEEEEEDEMPESVYGECPAFPCYYA